MPRELREARMGEIEMLRKQLDRAEVQLQASTKRYLEAESEVRDRDLRERALRIRADALEAGLANETAMRRLAEEKLVTREQIVEAIRPHLKDEAAVLAVSDEVDSLLTTVDATAEEAATESLALAAVLDEKTIEAEAMVEAISADERTVASFWEEK